MPHLRDHGVAGVVGLSALSFYNEYLPGADWHHMAWGAAFVFGNLLPDVSNFFYAHIAHKRGYDVDLWDFSSWDERLFKAIDEEWRILHPYKWLHSLALWVGVLLLVNLASWSFLPLFYTLLLQAIIYGSILHALMDGPGHEEHWLAFPFWPKPLRGLGNWWKQKWLTGRIWYTATVAVLIMGSVWHVASAAGFWP